MPLTTSVATNGNIVYVFDHLAYHDISILKYALIVDETPTFQAQGIALHLSKFCELPIIDPPVRATKYLFARINLYKEQEKLFTEFLTNLPTADVDSLGLLFHIISYTGRLPNVAEVAFATFGETGTINDYLCYGEELSNLPRFIYLNAMVNYCVSHYDLLSKSGDLSHIDFTRYVSNRSWLGKYILSRDKSLLGNEAISRVPLFLLNLFARLCLDDDSDLAINLEKLIIDGVPGWVLQTLNNLDSLTDDRKEVFTAMLLSEEYLYYNE